jgi:hypothetical protein
VNFTKPSRNTLTFTLVFHLVILQLTALAALRLPLAAMMAYVTQVSCFQPAQKISGR